MYLMFPFLATCLIADVSLSVAYQIFRGATCTFLKQMLLDLYHKPQHVREFLRCGYSNRYLKLQRCDLIATRMCSCGEAMIVALQ